MLRRFVDRVIITHSSDPRYADLVARLTHGNPDCQHPGYFHDFEWFAMVVSQPEVSESNLRDQMVNLIYECPYSLRKFRQSLSEFCAFAPIEQIVHILPNLLLQRPTSNRKLSTSCKIVVFQKISKLKSQYKMRLSELAKFIMLELLSHIHQLDTVDFSASHGSDELHPLWEFHSNIRFWLGDAGSNNLSRNAEDSWQFQTEHRQQVQHARPVVSWDPFSGSSPSPIPTPVLCVCSPIQACKEQ